MKRSIRTILCVVLAVSLCAAAVWLVGCGKGTNEGGTLAPQTTDDTSKGENGNLTSAPGSNARETAGPNEPAAPDFTVVNADGSSVKLSSLIGKPVVVNFWATWCAPCVGELPELQRAYEEYGDRVEFIFINVETDVNRVKSFIQENSYTFPLYFDLTGLAQEVYSVDSIPMSVFIDSEGHMAADNVGAMDYDTIVGYIGQIIE